VGAEYLVLMRLVQLTLGSLIGCLCIYFGYKLFSQIPVNVTNDGHFKMPKLGEAKLKVAPGIFFAILGAAIVYFSIDRSISIKANEPGSGTSTVEYSKVSPSAPPPIALEYVPGGKIEYNCQSGGKGPCKKF
jgi:hypothetical protein